MLTSYEVPNDRPLPGGVERDPGISPASGRPFRLFEQNPVHPSLHFKQIDAAGGVWSTRMGIGHRVLGVRDKDHVTWFWIGSHADYDKLA